ncbi:hypothetical protein BKA67DRAFT_536443 [Truncatella angustata]|uniref:Uncharacterized protein n=1 Tax=Truncatella angustata TaxID=152316 RepID=A0A9P8UI94_9PEZI|nr:uncharacterized protein BKA67DRAFT_536443 [Truncatella angustata]KAH6652720.1 hypothetical protein BKA67DRAFT_536443 [Truncatella angustata]
MSNGPLPSERCLLSELPARQVGDKHSFPSSSGSNTALVDVKLLLHGLRNGQTDVGQWVHVIGYITSMVKAISIHTKPTVPKTSVQALVVWSAEDFDIATYEKSF